MTVEEAIKDIQKRICCEGAGMRDYYYFCSDGCIYGVDNCSIAVAIKSLEKQIPKKPIPTMEKQEDGTKALSFKCPACNEFLFIGNWCWNCGQKIDWSEE